MRPPNSPRSSAETAGPDVEILIDAHGRFDVPTAIRLCRTLEEAGRDRLVPRNRFRLKASVRSSRSATR